MLFALLASTLAVAPPLVVAAQQPDAEVAQLGLATADGFRALAQVNTLPDFTPRGVVLPDGAHAVFAVVEARDWRGSLVQLDLRSGELVRLADDVFAQERPRALPDGRVLFVRVRMGEAPDRELAPALTGLWTVRAGEPPQQLATFDGYGANLAGVWRGQSLVYRVAREGASIWRVPARGQPVLLAKLPHGPFARDFHVLGDALMFATAVKPGSYAVQRLDLRTGALSTSLESTSDHLAPLAAGAKLLVTDEDLHAIDSKQPVLRGRAFALAATRDGAMVAARVETAMGEHLVLVDPGGSRELPVAGFFEVFGFAERAP